MFADVDHLKQVRPFIGIGSQNVAFPNQDVIDADFNEAVAFLHVLHLTDRAVTFVLRLRAAEVVVGAVEGQKHPLVRSVLDVKRAAQEGISPLL